MIPQPEPWLRGAAGDLDPLLAPILYAFQQAREDLAHWTQELDDDQIWRRPAGLAPVGFHLRHIAGSVDRLMTYVEGRQLSDAQFAALKTELEAHGTREQLLAGIERSFRNAERVVRKLDRARLRDAREVGRKKLPTTVIGLLTHTAEHTQRHVGQAIVTARVLTADASLS
ncbi:MAG: DinB family protein [Acidobacteriota bacterium]|nr:DinB family protein [Acidobacteriota bacterium]